MAILCLYRPQERNRANPVCVRAATDGFSCLSLADGITLRLGQRDDAGGLNRHMAAGVNTYVFASMYSVALRLATSTEMVGTAASIVTILAGWLVVLS